MRGADACIESRSTTWTAPGTSAIGVSARIAVTTTSGNSATAAAAGSSAPAVPAAASTHAAAHRHPLLNAMFVLLSAQCAFGS